LKFLVVVLVTEGELSYGEYHLHLKETRVSSIQKQPRKVNWDFW